MYIRRLIAALAVSGFLNIILLTTVTYSIIKERPPALYCDKSTIQKSKKNPPIVATPSGSETIQHFKSLPYEKLFERLSSSNPVESGYSERDLALACLVEFHHFDLERALMGLTQRLQKRTISYGRQPDGSPALITIHPALNDKAFLSILTFLENERWPQTAEGLFLLLQQKKGNYEPSLFDTFLLTSTFTTIEPLFKHLPVQKEELAEMLLEGTWDMAMTVAKQQKLSGETSDARRQRVLLDYVNNGSPRAAALFLKTDPVFAVKKLDDTHILVMLNLLMSKTAENEKFALQLLQSPRSDAVWKMAATRLYNYAGEKVPSKLSYQAALAKFVPSGAKEKATPIKHSESAKTVIKNHDRLYIVQEGDSLWKVARKFNVDIDILKRYNRLHSDTLKPNTALRIPITHIKGGSNAA